MYNYVMIDKISFYNNYFLGVSCYKNYMYCILARHVFKFFESKT